MRDLFVGLLDVVLPPVFLATSVTWFLWGVGVEHDEWSIFVGSVGMWLAIGRGYESLRKL